MVPVLKKIIMWALTYRCNMSCDYCFLRTKQLRDDELSDSDCLKLAQSIAENKEWKPDAVWLTGGEPTVRKCLPQIIRIFENNGIACVVTTNGLCSEACIENIIASNPRGINISLESFDEQINEKSREHTLRTIDSIKRVASAKNNHTVLGVSCVVTKDSIPQLVEFAGFLQQIGVEYLSMNPIIGDSNSYTEKDFIALKKSKQIIEEKVGIKTPSDFYLSLVVDCHMNTKLYDLKCPAGENYFFISPWGEFLPCSNEFWQQKNRSEITRTSFEYERICNEMIHQFNTNQITTLSKCFGDRCIGCWKLYYDTIFTRKEIGGNE